MLLPSSRRTSDRRLSPGRAGTLGPAAILRRRSFKRCGRDDHHHRGQGRNRCGEVEMMTRLAGLLLLLGTSAGFAAENEPSALERHGQALAQRLCSECHAVGREGQSSKCRSASVPYARSPGGSRFVHRPIARRAHGWSSRYADIPVHTRRCARLRALSEIHPGTVAYG